MSRVAASPGQSSNGKSGEGGTELTPHDFLRGVQALREDPAVSLRDLFAVVLKSYPPLLIEALPYFLDFGF